MTFEEWYSNNKPPREWSQDYEAVAHIWSQKAWEFKQADNSEKPQINKITSHSSSSV